MIVLSLIIKIYDFINKLWLFKLYEIILEKKIDKNKIPKHIGVIMDGNRRMARMLGEESIKGHFIGAKKVKDFIKWCVDLNIETITLYSFSLENFGRPKKEVEELMNLFEREFRAIAHDKNVHKHEINIRAIGRLELLPERVQEAIKYAEEKTKNYKKHRVNIAIAYGGRQELVDALKKIAKKVKNNELDIEDINVDTISEHLYTAYLPNPNPDLIIRTSGEERISNFLIWQSSYSELYFCDTYWPNFRKIDLLRAIRNYQTRVRRFGR